MPMEILSTTVAAEKEKTSAALNSVVAAMTLMLIKIVAGIAANSLGILAEAAHSGLVLIASINTFLAVRNSNNQPMAQNNYFQGKIENSSTLIGTLLLLATCVWIIYGSIQRLFFKPVAANPPVWAFLIMLVSIGVCFSHSRNLFRAAKKHNSRTLEANALHFRTDIWSSALVILGLVGICIAMANPAFIFMGKVDTIAALVIAGIVIYSSADLGIRAMMGLFNYTPKNLNQQIEKSVVTIPGIISCYRVQVRTSSPCLFIELHIYIDPQQSLRDAHLLAKNAAEAVRKLTPKTDVIVHAKPAPVPHNI